MQLSSHQDYSASLAGWTATTLRLNRVFPELKENTRSANSDLQIKFQAELHDAMGWRADHQDRY